MIKKIGLIVDEGADLPQEIIGKYQIAIVPLKINWPEVENLPGENIFQKMREAKKRGIKSFTKTSQPSPKDFLDIFKRQLEKFEKIICLTITSKLSGTYNSAIQAKNFLGLKDSRRVFVVDSLNGSAGKALLVFKAIDLIEKGKRAAEKIVEELEKLIPKICLIGMLEDPKWFEASGRLSHSLANWVRKMAKIGVRPLLGVKKGIITAVGIRTGVKDVPSALFKEFEIRTREIRGLKKRIRMIVTHGDCPVEALKLKNMLQKEFKNIEIVFLNLIDNVIGSIAGPGTLVCAWCEN